MEKREILDRLDTIYHDIARAHDVADYWELKREVNDLLYSLKGLMDDIRIGR